jgi:hypothetical protein
MRQWKEEKAAGRFRNLVINDEPAITGHIVFENFFLRIDLSGKGGRRE